MGANPVGSLDDFTTAFTEWAKAHVDTHTLFVAIAGGETVGMIWVALAPRLPSPGSLHRVNADIQSFYVVPESRGQGIGTALVRAALAWAREVGAERAEVHSGTRAVSMYERAGFAVSPLLLEHDLHPGGTA